MTERQKIAYNICNGRFLYNTIEHYPWVYQAAYELLYKGRITKKTLKAVKDVQCDDIRKLGYVPENLFKALQSIISPASLII